MTINTYRLKIRDLARNIQQCVPLRTLLVFINLCLILTVACAFRTASLPIILTNMDNGKTVTVSSGNQVIIQLPDNSGSTGYTWNFTTSRNQVLTWQNATYIPPTGHPMPGASGTMAFTFLAHDSGSVHIQFALQRTWETNVPPVQLFTVTIQVQH
ncbi:MAG TPA: protease inhibitor I42 family protein [Ktedonobacteraceae bacterium]